MWIFPNDAALSIVKDRSDPARLMVRARVVGDIERIFPSAHETEEADYRYRASILRSDVSATLAQRAESIDYDNFKNSCDTPRHDAYLNVWESWMDVARRLMRAGPDAAARGASGGACPARRA